MKKGLLILTAGLLLCASPANAQLGGLLKKAAKKAVQQQTDRLLNKGSESATDTQPIETPSGEEGLPTYAELMAQMPALPTAQQLVSYKEAELNEQTMKMMLSPVTNFNSTVLSLSMQAASLSYANMDTAQMMEAAYRNAELSTGLSRQELEKLSNMSEEQQEAYLMAHYQQGKSNKATVDAAVETAKLMEPLEPTINRWGEVDEQVNKLYEQADEQCRAIYKKYAATLAKTEGKNRNRLLINYYTEILPIRIPVVQQAMQLRLTSQLPIAEEIEKGMAGIRAAHPETLTSLVNYPQMTATQYFAEVAKLLEIPEYVEEQ